MLCVNVCLCLHVCIFCVYLCGCACVYVSELVFMYVLFVFLQEYSLLYEEASFFQLAPLQAELERWRTERECRGVCLKCECVVIHVAPELGERISVSAHRAVIAEVFPEVRDVISSSLNTSWNRDPTHIIHFPLNGYCHLNSVQVQNPSTPMFVRDQTHHCSCCSH